MVQNPPRIVVSQRTEQRRAVTSWSLQTLTLEINFQGAGQQKPDSRTLSERLDDQLGPRQLDYRLVLGPVEVLLEASDRIKSIDVFTHIDQWRRAPLLALPEQPDHVWVAFAVEYDGNRIASLDLPVAIIWDPAGRQLALRLGAESSPVYWYAVADMVFFGTDVHGVLREIRCCEAVVQGGLEQGAAG